MSVAPPLRSLIFLVFCFFETVFMTAQPVVEFEKTIGGNDYEEQNAFLRLSDGYLMGGNSRSANGTGEVSSPMFGNYDFWIVKTDFALKPMWNRAFGGSGEDWLRAIIATSDGGFLAAGYSNSPKSGSKTEDSRGDYDFWVVKIDAAGNQIWDKTFGGLFNDQCYSILECPDQSGYLLGGFSNSNQSGDKTENGRGDLDFWLIKINKNGQKLWDKTLGGVGHEQFSSMCFAPDGDVILAGGTNSPPASGEVGLDAARGGVDFWMVKYSIDNQQVMWSHRYGGAAEDFAYDVKPSKTGGYFLGGNSQSAGNGGASCTNCKRSENYGGRDFWLIKTDANGQLVADVDLGGAGLDVLYNIHENFFGQVLVAGVSDSPISGNKTTAGKGGYDFWAVFLDKNLLKKWELDLGGSKDDALTKILQNPDGSYWLTGHSESDIGFEKTQDSRGKNDFWAVKTYCDLAEQLELDGEKCSPKPASLDASIPTCSTCQYLWSQASGAGGQTEPILEVPHGTTDSFRVAAGDANGCLAFDSLWVDIGITPVFDLGKDTVIFTGETLEIGVENPMAQFHWNTGDTTNFITVSKSGVYALTVTDASGCTARDYARIFVKNKKAVYIPNLFTPDFDGHNDYFFPFADRSVERVLNFQVFDRRGEKLFETHDIEPNSPLDGWDGTFRTYRVAPDTYFYFIELLFEDGDTKLFKGSVNVIR